jgi:DNA-binding beta-propeller fold protein YncE
VDAQGTVYVADRGNGEVDTVNAGGVLRSTFGGELRTAEDIALDPVDSTLYVSDGMAHRIQAFSLQGGSLRTIGSFGTSGAGLNRPRGIAVSSRRELHVVDSGNARIQVYGLNGEFRRSYGGLASESGELQVPRDIVFDAAGSAIVSDPIVERLAWFDPDGKFRGHTQLKDANGRIGAPLYLAIGPGGRLFATVIFR